MRDAFFASPQFPRLLKPDSLKETIARGVEGRPGLRRKGQGWTLRCRFTSAASLAADDVEISDEMFLITAEEAKKSIEPPRLASILLTRPGDGRTGQEAGVLGKGPGSAPAATSTLARSSWTATGGTIDDRRRLPRRPRMRATSW